MIPIHVTREDFLADRQGVKFADVVNDPEMSFATVMDFFNDPDRQRRMEESEIHHDRAPLAGVVRELESEPDIDRFLNGIHSRRSTRLRQAIGVLVRIIMEKRGWQKSGKKGSLGVRAVQARNTPAHNTGGLAFWFIRAERYERKEGMPYQSVGKRCEALQPPTSDETKSTEKSEKSGKPGAAKSLANGIKRPSGPSGRRQLRA